MKTLVLGLGNPILRDDGVGLRVAQALRPRLVGRPGVEVDEDTWGGLRLMERLIGYDRAIVIDAMSGGKTPGTIEILSPDDLPTRRSSSLHDTSLPVALELGRQAGAHLPPSSAITLVGIGVEDVIHFGEDLTPKVEGAVPRAVEVVESVLGEA